MTSNISGSVGWRRTLTNELSVPAELNAAADDGDAKCISRRVCGVTAHLIGSAFQDVGVPGAVETKRKINVADKRAARCRMAQPRRPERVGLSDNEFDVAVRGSGSPETLPLHRRTRRSPLVFWSVAPLTVALMSIRPCNERRLTSAVDRERPRQRHIAPPETASGPYRPEHSRFGAKRRVLHNTDG